MTWGVGRVGTGRGILMNPMSEKFFKTFGYMMNRNIYYDKNDKKFKNIKNK